MSEFERIESLRRDMDKGLNKFFVMKKDMSEIELRLYSTPQSGAQETRYQKCGGGRRVIRKKVGSGD